MSGLHLISEKDGATELINLQPHTPLKVKSLILKLLTIFLTELHIQKELLLLDNLCVLLENKTLEKLWDTISVNLLGRILN
jgi:hypothetical protein